MLDSLKKQIEQLQRLASTPAYKSAARAAGVCVATLFLSTYAPLWIQRAFFSSPFLGLSVLIVITLFIFRLWKQYNADVKVTIFRLMKHSAVWIKVFSREYLWLDTTNVDKDTKMTRLRNRKLVRTAVLFIMAQHCIAPNSRLVWVHSVLAYKFMVDVFRFIGSYYANQEPDDPQRTPVTLIVTNTLKLAFATAVVIHQFTYVSKLYLLVTCFYFLLIQQYCEQPLTRILENFQFDFFEGLEQYYVMGFLGFVEILFAFVFMLWTLVQHLQFLMLLALYTNVYTGGREIVNNAVTAAFTEWTLLAQFKRASAEELAELDDVCSICLANMRCARKTPCRHIFHGHCLRRWLREKLTCPICSKKIL